MSKKHIVFCHQNYPAQFGPVSEFILKNYEADITFISEYLAKPVAQGIRHIPYKPVTTGHEESPYFFSRYFEQECASAHGVFEAFQRAKLNQPDVMVGHVAFGNLSLFHVAYTNVPKIGFFELFYNPYRENNDTRAEYPVPIPNRLRVPMRNATQLVELEYCTKGYSPTSFQKSTYPSVYEHKLEVLFDGINTQFYCPGKVDGRSELKRTWPSDCKLVTYVSRGLEAMRGFDIFMEVAHRVSQKRKDVHFVVAGNPKTHYGSEMINVKESTFKEHVLNKGHYDLNRFHFLDWVSENALRDLFRLSGCHFYWTVPFTLSWSLFQAMSTGVSVLASNTAPVRDIVFHNETGILAEPFDLDAMAEQMLEMLDKPKKYTKQRQSARELMVSNYGFDVCLPKLSEFYFAKESAIPDSKITAVKGIQL